MLRVSARHDSLRVTFNMEPCQSGERDGYNEAGAVVNVPENGIVTYRGRRPDVGMVEKMLGYYVSFESNTSNVSRVKIVEDFDSEPHKPV